MICSELVLGQVEAEVDVEAHFVNGTLIVGFRGGSYYYEGRSSKDASLTSWEYCVEWVF